MAKLRCPGQDMRNWKPEDIFEVKCPHCDKDFEMWKDEPFLLCPSCGREVRNPRLDLGCAKWCKYAEECLGKQPEQTTAANPVVEKIIAELAKLYSDWSGFTDQVHKVLEEIFEMPGKVDEEPCVVIIAALLVFILHKRNVNLDQEWSKWQKILSEVKLDDNMVKDIKILTEKNIQ